MELYSAVCDARMRAIVIVECKSLEDGKQLLAWTGIVGEGDPDPICYVKICLVHMHESEKMALALLQRFVCDGASLEHTNKLIRQMGVD